MRQKIFALDGALRATAQEGLAMDRSRATAFFAGLALAMAGNTRQAAAVVDELSKRFPGDTVVNNSWGPTIRSEIEVNRGNASKAIELLQLASPYETGLVVRLVPNYARGASVRRGGAGTRAYVLCTWRCGFNVRRDVPLVAEWVLHGSAAVTIRMVLWLGNRSCAGSECAAVDRVAIRHI